MYIIWHCNSMESFMRLVRPHSKRHHGKLGNISIALKYDVMPKVFLWSRTGFISGPDFHLFFRGLREAGVQKKQSLPVMMSSQPVEFGRPWMWLQFAWGRSRSSFTESVNGGESAHEEGEYFEESQTKLHPLKNTEIRRLFNRMHRNNRDFGRTSETRRRKNNQVMVDRAG